MKAEIDLMENRTLIIKDGQIIDVPTPPKGFGTQTITWQEGKPCHGKLEHTVRF